MYKRMSRGWAKHLDFILLDLISLHLAFIAAYMLRHGFGLLPYSVRSYQNMAVLLSVLDLLTAIMFNTMHNVIKRGRYRELMATVNQVLPVFLGMVLFLFTIQSSAVYSRIVIYLTSLLHLIFGYVLRLIWKKLLLRRGVGASKASMLLVAEEDSVAEVLSKISPLDRFKVRGLILVDRDAAGEILEGVPVVANLSDAADYICRKWVDEVYIYPTWATLQMRQLAEICHEMAVTVHMRLPIQSSLGSGKVIVEKLGGEMVATSSFNYVTPLQMGLKRVIDLVGALFGSLIALVIMLVVGPKIKKESPGPILFKQERIGQNGKPFKVYKIRSMYMDAEERKSSLMSRNRNADGMMFKLDFDPRIIGNEIMPDGTVKTGIGDFIRRTSLDEFPQFFNVLKGEMSMVGTRPPTKDEWVRYSYHHRARLAMKPGITGMWQTSGRSKITDFEEVVRLDTEYIQNWSLGLDLKLILKTVKIVFTRDGAM